ncbi:hypothetical protein SAMN05446037_10181 [Anaerovirgula multivorans]|uniref:Uncharacterized protein n=1 Tax=Anaerovirgula multivorans TaxID=312168 RepID=A0A239GNQ7_9FIRM|nr:hypothetical protein [Anaerovirgula multivorans]SNS70611.1 hypothetical protein SAMN05446037_10181 [Anaerovirgula multivorans]
MTRFKRSILAVLLVTLFAILITGCGKNNIEKVISLGSVEGSTYTNDYFGSTFTIPEEWVIADEEEMEMITNMGQELIAGDDEELNKEIDLSKEKTLNMVMAFKYPLTHTDGYNPNIMCIAENLNLVEGLAIKNGDDYLEYSKEVLQMSGMPYSFEDVYTEKIGGKEFHVLVAKLDFGVMEITQKYYSTIINKYAFNFIVSYSNDEELEELNGVLNTVEFK